MCPQSNQQLVLDIKSIKGPKEPVAITSPQVSVPQPRNLDQTATRCCFWKSAAGCINSLYHTAGNISLGGAFAAVATYTVTDLDDRQKDAVGGLTMGLIFLGAICFWNLTCCPQKAQKPISEGTYSGFQSMSERGEYQKSDAETDESDII